MIVNRRSFLIGSAALIATPAIVKASSLMPVRELKIRGIRFDSPICPDHDKFVTVRGDSDDHRFYSDFVSRFDYGKLDHVRNFYDRKPIPISEFSEVLKKQKELGWHKYKYIW